MLEFLRPETIAMTGKVAELESNAANELDASVTRAVADVDEFPGGVNVANE